MQQVAFHLKHIVNTFDDVSFSQHYFVCHLHEPVLHACLYSVHQMYAVHEKIVKKFLLYITPVGKHLPVELLSKHAPYSPVPVIYVCPCKTEGYDFSAVVAKQMQLEAVTPAHGPLAVSGNTPENLVVISSDVVADRYHGAVHETYPVTSTEGMEFHEQHHLEENSGHKFDKSVIGDVMWEIAPHMVFYKER